MSETPVFIDRTGNLTWSLSFYCFQTRISGLPSSGLGVTDMRTSGGSWVVCFGVGGCGLPTDSGGLGGGPPNRRRRSSVISVPGTPLERLKNVEIIKCLIITFG